MSLLVTKVARNLESSPMLIGMPLEDFMVVTGAAFVAYFIGLIFMSGTKIFHLPAEMALAAITFGVGWVSITTLKVGKPNGYVLDIIEWHTKPHSYSCTEPDKILTDEYIEDEEHHA